MIEPNSGGSVEWSFAELELGGSGVSDPSGGGTISDPEPFQTIGVASVEGS